MTPPTGHRNYMAMPLRPCVTIATGLLFLALLPLGYGSAAGDPPRASSQPPPERVSFSSDVYPLLESRCGACHMDGSSRGELSLDSRDQMLAHATAVVPGDSEASRLIHVVRGDDPDMIMPMRGDRLTDEQIALLARWIDTGATWDAPGAKRERTHAHLLPRAVDLPDSREGIDHPIDLLIDDYLKERGIELAPVVNDAAFLRRASLDLVGLLPRVEQLEEFNNYADLNKREQAVAQLLDDDAAFAAHWLSFWNDLLRNDYSGTGYIDGGRTQITAWLYESLQDNKPYDDFVTELVNPTEASAGFSRGIRWRGEASASQRWELQFSRGVGQVFLGINMKCASCHDSFVDNWKLADAYGLAAIIADEPLELYRCDVPTGEFARPAFVFEEVGQIEPDAPKEERLSRLAELLVDPGNGRTPRTIVNRIWARLLGRGLVEPVDSMAAPAWSEDLLDYLSNFLVEHDYDLRELIRLIATSNAYQRRAVAGNDGAEFVFRGPSPQRMTAEQFIDAVWTLTGAAPTTIDARLHVSASAPIPRASLMNSSALMRSLGRPAREQIVSTRPNTLTTLQALDLANGTDLASNLSEGAARLLGRFESSNQLIEHVYRAALSRPPTEEEMRLAVDFLGETPVKERVADFLWAVIMLPDFQMVR